MALMVALGWDSILDLIGGGENADISSGAVQFAQAARNRDVIPPQLQPTGRKKPASRGEMTEEDCTAENTTNHSRPPFTGMVLEITNGDTIRMNIQGAEVPVRLWGIDAPEIDRPEGANARDYLASLVPRDSKVEIHPVETDRHGRIVAVMGPEKGWSTNMLMVAYGWAHHLDEGLSKDHICLEEAQKVAQFYGMGVW